MLIMMRAPRSKKPRLVHTPPPRRSRRIAGRLNACFDDLGVDELAIILGFLGPSNIMRARLNNRMRDAAKQTIVPMAKFVVDSVKKYNALVAMSTALPNLQQITLRDLGGGHKYIDGEDSNGAMAAETANLSTLDINFMSNFRKLSTLYINGAPLNGRYPNLFNNFPLLKKILICNQRQLKLDLHMLAGLPMLEELLFSSIGHLTGNINSLRVLKDTLTKVRFWCCDNDVQGCLMDLADFPRLKALNLSRTAVTGDIWEISERDFLAIKELILPQRVYGGRDTCTFQLISDVPNVISAFYPIMRQRPVLLKYWSGMLARDSPDWYSGGIEYDVAPFCIKFVQAGSRIGYHWFALEVGKFACEVIWLDPEPDTESSDYEKYTEELQEIEGEVDMFKGFQQPPTEDEFHLLQSRTC